MEPSLFGTSSNYRRVQTVSLPMSAQKISFTKSNTHFFGPSLRPALLEKGDRILLAIADQCSMADSVAMQMTRLIENSFRQVLYMTIFMCSVLMLSKRVIISLAQNNSRVFEHIRRYNDG